MTQVFYFGLSSMCPVTDYKYNLSNVIHCVNFNAEELMKMESEEEAETYADYLQMIKHIDPKKLKFKKVVCGYKSIALLDDKNELWSFGSSLNGQVGTNKMKYNVNRPFNVSRLNDRYFLDVALSSTHTLAISNTQKLYGWGSTEFGCLGEPMKEIHQYSMIKLRKNIFVSPQESYERKTVYDSITCGDHFSLLICNDKLFSFGKEDKGRLGCGQKNIKYTQQPLQISLPHTIRQIKGVSCGRNHCLIWDQDGLIYSWGDGSDGKLGHSSVNGGYNYMIVDPQQIKALEEHRIIQASCGYRHSCAITFKGEIYTWGRTVYYKHEKRNELPLDYLRPKKIASFFHSDNQNISAGAIFIKISSYAYHNAAVDQRGFLYTWGQNKENCLGHDNSNDCNYPICVEEFTSMKIVDVACGHNYTVVISTKSNNQLAYKNFKEFRMNLLKNATQNIAKIKEYCESKLNRQFLTSSNLHSRATSASNYQSPNHQNNNNNNKIGSNPNNNKNNGVILNNSQFVKQETRILSSRNKSENNNHYNNTSNPINKQQMIGYQQSQFNKPINNKEGKKQQMEISNHLKQKFNDLITSEKLFKQNITNGLKKLEMESKFILNQRPYSSKPTMSTRQKTQSLYNNGNGRYLNIKSTTNQNNINIDNSSPSKNINSKSKSNRFFEYSNNKIIFDTVHDYLDSQYEEFNQNTVEEKEKTPRNSIRDSIQTTLDVPQQQLGVQKRESENSTRKERLSEIQKKAEDRRIKSNQHYKGIVLDENIFNQEIEQIYKEYKEADLIEQDKSKLIQKYVRDKSDDFLRSRSQINLLTRNTFQDARQEYQQSNTKSQDITRTLVNSSQTLNIIQQSIPKTQFQSLSSSVYTSPSRNISYHHDYLKKDKWKINDEFLYEKMQSSQQKYISRDEQIQAVLERKQLIELEKKQNRDIKRQEYILKSREYQEQQEKLQLANHNQNSVRLNWFTYLNVEKLCVAFKELAKIGLQNQRDTFFFVNRVKKIQRLFRKKLVKLFNNIKYYYYYYHSLKMNLFSNEIMQIKVLRRMSKFTEKQRMILRIMCLKLVYQIRIKKLEKQTRLIVLNTLRNKAISKISIKLLTIRNNVISIQTFLRWCYSCQNFQLNQLTKIWDTHLINMCQNGNTTRVQDSKNQQTYKENLDKLSSVYGFKRTFSGDFTISSAKYDDYKTYAEINQNIRQSLHSILPNNNSNTIPDFYATDNTNNNLLDLIHQKANNQQTKFGLVLASMNVGAKAQGQQLNEFIKQGNLQTQGEILLSQDKKSVRIISQQNLSPSKQSSIQNKDQQQSIKSMAHISQHNSQQSINVIENDQDNEYFNENNNKDISMKKSMSNINNHKIINNNNNNNKQKNTVTIQEIMDQRNYTFDFNKTLLPYSIHANDIITPNQYSIRLEIIKANEIAMKVAAQAESTIKKKVLLMVLRSLRNKYKNNLEQFSKIQEKFMIEKMDQINMERARLMLITPPTILNQIWQKELDTNRLGKVKQYKRNEKKNDHLPFFDLRVKIASQIQNSPIKPTFKLQITQDQFKLFFNKYYDMVRKQYAFLEAKGLIKSQLKKKK